MPRLSIPWSVLEDARIALEEKARTRRMVTSKEQAVKELFESLDRMLKAHHPVSDVLAILGKYGFDMDAGDFDRAMRAERARRSSPANAKGGATVSKLEAKPPVNGGSGSPSELIAPNSNGHAPSSAPPTPAGIEALRKLSNTAAGV